MAETEQATPIDPTASTDALRAAEVLRELFWFLTALQTAGLRDYCRPPLPEAHPQQVTAPCILPVQEISKSPPASSGFEPVAPPSTGGSSTLATIREDLGDCKRCRLHEGRAHIVFGEGAPAARLVFVGEGPGYDEDQQGRPFVGRAGKLLDKMIGALGRTRKEVYICNAVKCRPPNNRTPDADEIEACSPFLFRQLEALRPHVICALGLTAAQTLLGGGIPMNRLRGRTHHWRGIPVVCTYHPAYLLRTPSQKAATWQDLLAVERLLSEHTGTAST